MERYKSRIVKVNAKQDNFFFEGEPIFMFESGAIYNAEDFGYMLESRIPDKTGRTIIYTTKQR